MAKAKKHLGSADDIEAAFYEAIGCGDLNALMALWADDHEIVCIHPGGVRLVGHEAIRASWEAIFKDGGVPIRPAQLHAAQNVMSAIHNVIETIELPSSAQPDIHILTTNVYLKTPVGWRMVVHHASVAPGRAVIKSHDLETLH